MRKPAHILRYVSWRLVRTNDARIERLGFSERGSRREDHLCHLCRKILSIFGGSGLDQQRVALDRACYIERTADREMFALVVEHVNFVG